MGKKAGRELIPVGPYAQIQAKERHPAAADRVGPRARLLAQRKALLQQRQQRPVLKKDGGLGSCDSLGRFTKTLERIVARPTELEPQERITRIALQAGMGRFGKVVADAAINLSRAEEELAASELIEQGVRNPTREQARKRLIENMARDKRQVSGGKLKILAASVVNPILGGMAARRTFASIREERLARSGRLRSAGETPIDLGGAVQMVRQAVSGKAVPSPKLKEDFKRGSKQKRRGILKRLIDFLEI